MSDVALKYIGVLLTLGGLVFGFGRYVGQLEHRIHVLELQQQYMHGEWKP